MALIWKLGFIVLLCFGAFELDRRYPGVLENPDAIVSLVLLAVIVSALLFSNGPRRAPDPRAERRRAAALNVSVWLGIFAGLGLVYDNRDSLHQSALRALSALQPGMPVSLSEDETVLTRSHSGHFTAFASINGHQVTMLVDTGATDVALPYKEAARVGVNVERLRFDRPVMTANGEAKVAAARLDQVRVGSIVLRNVNASVAEPGKLGGALLGMSFLSRLREFTFRGDKLILKQ